MNLKRISAGIAAIALVGATTLGSFAPSAWALPGDDCDYESSTFSGWYSCELIGYDGDIPEGANLVVDDDEQVIGEIFGSEEELYEHVFGEEGTTLLYEYFEMMEKEELSENDPKAKQMMMELYDKLGIVDLGSGRDFHFENERGEKIKYSGSGVTIQYEFDDAVLTEDSDFVKDYLIYSARKWHYAVIHIGDDKSIEYLPVSVDEESGVWMFTAKSFSFFAPVLVADEEEAPKTLDNTSVFIGTACAGMASLFVLGAWFMRKERR